MKTTIDIPDPLYKKVKIRAIERGQTLKQVVLTSLERELEAPRAIEEAPVSYWAKRKLLPEFEAAQKAGAYRPKPGDRDITDLISDDRDGH
ncbi:MAG: hypothetical protein HY360_23645 [Verrucomicrobia bacterium]|nr:hypothetical protein [Verrucomicrobiota bacterium]